MNPTAGSIRIFRLFGIDVHLHWLWFLLLGFELFQRGGYSQPFWNIVEFLSIFGIVLLHEFGHALACRSTGGRADTIVLWLLGGVAYVAPPRRPGAVLWSIVAGPLVNVALIPVTLIALRFFGSNDSAPQTDLDHYLYFIAIVNIVLLVFNLLPIYPLDGGQILQAVLWFFLGQALSLRIVAIIGLLAGVAGVIAGIVFWTRVNNPFLILVAMFIAFRAWQGFRAANYLSRLEELERAQNNPWNAPNA